MDHKRGDKYDKRHDGDRTEKPATTDDSMKREKRANAEQHGYADKPGKEMKAKDKIQAIDRNGDGRLTSEEHEAGSTSMFEKMDTDRDGYLSADEMKAGHEKMMKKHD